MEKTFIKRIPFDIQCSIIERITIWEELIKYLSLYESDKLYQQAIWCVKRIDAPQISISSSFENTIRILHRTIDVKDLIKFPKLETINYPILLSTLEDVKLLQNYLNDNRNLINLTISIPFRSFINEDYDNFIYYLNNFILPTYLDRFTNLESNRKGHLVCYRQVPVTKPYTPRDDDNWDNNLDLEFVVRQIERLYEIDIASGYLYGAMNDLSFNIYQQYLGDGFIKIIPIVIISDSPHISLLNSSTGDNITSLITNYNHPVLAIESIIVCPYVFYLDPTNVLYGPEKYKNIRYRVIHQHGNPNEWDSFTRGLYRISPLSDLVHHLPYLNRIEMNTLPSSDTFEGKEFIDHANKISSIFNYLFELNISSPPLNLNPIACEFFNNIDQLLTLSDKIPNCRETYAIIPEKYSLSKAKNILAAVPSNFQQIDALNIYISISDMNSLQLIKHFQNNDLYQFYIV